LQNLTFQRGSCARSPRKFNYLQTNSLHNGTGNFQMYCREDFSTNREIIGPRLRLPALTEIRGFLYRSALLVPCKAAIDIGMAIKARIPIFCVVQRDGQQWTVEAEWPDGTIEQVDIFKGHSDAMEWVSNRSEAWLQNRKA
jgi:hypothetical protein